MSLYIQTQPKQTFQKLFKILNRSEYESGTGVDVAQQERQ